MRKNKEMPRCIKCNTLLKGYVPVGTKITCYFCNNPRGEQDDDANVILKSVDVR